MAVASSRRLLGQDAPATFLRTLRFSRGEAVGIGLEFWTVCRDYRPLLPAQACGGPEIHPAKHDSQDITPADL